MRDLDESEERQAELRLNAFMGHFLGQPVTRGLIVAVDETIELWKQGYKRRGLRAPHVVALIFPLIGKIDIVFGEQTRKGIETIIVNLTRKYPTITSEDIAFAVGRVWPDYKRKVMDAAHAVKRDTRLIGVG